MVEKPWKPTRDQLLAAKGKTVPDLIASGLKVLFCGINPGLYTAACGASFCPAGKSVLARAVCRWIYADDHVAV